MKFGPVDLAQAQGAVLAHGVMVDDGRIKKGTLLGEAELSRLRSAGVDQVVVARLDADDVDEDRAAQELAQRLAGDGIRVAAPFTGRCNLFADHAGVSTIDVSRIDALNRVDESITVATVPNWQPVAVRQMLATVKIIPFAVAAEHQRAALAVLEGARAVSVRRVVVAAPLLIQTRLPGLKTSILDKTRRITEARIGALGAGRMAEARCGHDVDSLAAAIARGIDAGSDLVMVVGASAIVDRRDVIPRAIEQCGGEVDHFGMPVDPGNLLLFGHSRGVPVLGMPGCARSAAYNGLDRVLTMLAAGHRVSRADICAMGVGGLLKEAPGRPQSRRGSAPEPAAQPRVAALVLAAGQSRRMGARNKLLIELDGRSMLEHVLEAIARSQVEWTVLVTGHEAQRIRERIGERSLIQVHNPEYENGLSTSLAAGLDALPAEADAVLVCLGDMPRVSGADMNRLLAAFDPPEGRSICVPTFNGKRGNPTLWDRRFFARMREVRGDVGARHLIGEHEEQVVEVPMGTDAVLTDVDSPLELERLVGAGQRPP